MKRWHLTNGPRQIRSVMYRAVLPYPGELCSVADTEIPAACNRSNSNAPRYAVAVSRVILRIGCVRGSLAQRL